MSNTTLQPAVGAQVERGVRPLRWMCQSCAWIGNDAELLTAANPFAPDESIVGCPMCNAVDDIVSACDEPGCDREGSYGWPTEDGDYRRTCFEHSMWRAESAA